MKIKTLKKGRYYKDRHRQWRSQTSFSDGDGGEIFVVTNLHVKIS